MLEKKDFEELKTLDNKVAVFIYGYLLGVKSCKKSLVNIEKMASQDLENYQTKQKGEN